jgi:hypothetical protein
VTIGVVATHALFTGQDWRAMFGEGVRRLWITDTILSRRRPHEPRTFPSPRCWCPVLAPAGS